MECRKWLLVTRQGRLTCVAVVLFGFLFFLGIKPDSQVLAIGQPVPVFRLPNSTGHIVDLASLRGQVVLVNFWATSCGACVEEIPSLNRLAAQFESAPFVILGISLDGASHDAWLRIAAFQRQVPMAFPVLLDEDGQVADQYGTFMIPESFLVDARGRLVRKVTGAIAWDDPQVIREISTLIEKAAS